MTLEGDLAEIMPRLRRASHFIFRIEDDDADEDWNAALHRTAQALKAALQKAGY